MDCWRSSAVSPARESQESRKIFLLDWKSMRRMSKIKTNKLNTQQIREKCLQLEFHWQRQDGEMICNKFEGGWKKC